MSLFFPSGPTFRPKRAGRLLFTQATGLLVLMGAAGCIRSCAAPATPDLTQTVLSTCAAWPCQVRIADLVPERWDTLWATWAVHEDSFPPSLGLREADRARLITEWSGSLGTERMLLLTADGAVVWRDICDNNVNENFDPPPCWLVDAPPGPSGWVRLSREEAVFEVERTIGVQENDVRLRPVGGAHPR